MSDGVCSHRPDDESLGRGNLPVINASQDGTQEIVRWPSRKTGAAYRLFSESEWEYVARADSTCPYHFGSVRSTN